MFPKQNYQYESEKQKSLDIQQQSNLKFAPQNYVQNLIFIILTFFVDLIILIQNTIYLQYVLPKMILNFTFGLILIIFRNKIKEIQMNYSIFVIKLHTIFHIFLLGQNYILVIAFVCEQYSIQMEKIQNICQRIIIKIGCLILIIISQQILDIIFVICILLLEIVKIIYLINLRKEINNISQPEEHQFMKETQFISNFEQLPLCVLLISKKDFSVKFKNQIFYNYFSNLSYKESDFDDLIRNQLQFSIIGDNIQNQVKVSIDNSFRNSIFKKKQSLNDLENKQFLEKFTLIQILSRYEYYQFFQCGQILQIDLYCTFISDSCNEQIFAGQLLINYEKDNVVLSLFDISKQHRFQQDKIKDDFKCSLIHSFSHELRTPLNSSCNFLYCLLNHETIQDELKINLIQPAINCLHLQQYLINDIIDFSSLSSGNIQINVKCFRIKDLIDEIRKLFKSLIEMKNLILYIDLSDNQLEYITTDFQRLTQILVNLIQNSIKFSNKGTIVIKLITLASDNIKISVKDEGYGIEQNRLQEINQMLQEMECRKKFQNHKTWSGFRLLISSMLIQKLRPNNYKSIIIKSDGFQKGTKFSFYIRNHKAIDQSSSLNQKDKSYILYSKPKESLISDSNIFQSINGTLVQISEIFFPNRKLQMNSQSGLKFISKSLKSCEEQYEQNSSENFKILDYDYTIAEFKHLQAFVFTQNDQKQNKNLNQNLSPKNNDQPQILNYQKLKLIEDQESQQIFQQILQKIKKCTCNRILSVDDEIFNQKSLQYLLGQYGFELILAFNGQEAIEIIQNTQKCSETCCLYLLILMDYQMPVMNGLQATKILRQMMESNILQNITIVGLTAFNSKNDIEKCYQSGMNSVLTKPLVINEFFELLKKL